MINGWKKLVYYKCGKNENVIKDTFLAKFNLIRGGSIMELVIIELLKGKKLNVGFVVEEDKKGILGCAPYLLIMKDKIVPVEIKCLKSK